MYSTKPAKPGSYLGRYAIDWGVDTGHYHLDRYGRTYGHAHGMGLRTHTHTKPLLMFYGKTKESLRKRAAASGVEKVRPSPKWKEPSPGSIVKHYHFRFSGLGNEVYSHAHPYRGGVAHTHNTYWLSGFGLTAKSLLARKKGVPDGNVRQNWWLQKHGLVGRDGDHFYAV